MEMPVWQLLLQRGNLQPISSVATGSPLLGAIADFFCFFAIVTSFLGIALGLFDFLADGLKIPRKKWEI